MYIGEQADFITEQTQKVIYTEGIVRNDEQHEQALDRHPETKKARNLGIETLSYPQGLAQVFNPCFGIAVTGTHGKSTTTSLLGLILQKSELPTSVLTGTNLTQFDETNYYTSGNKYFAIEACEHKRHFLNYYPNISIITNAEVDHLDYYKDEQDYLDAFTTFQSQTSDWIIYNGLDTNLKRIIDPRKNSIALLEDGNYTSNGPDAIDPGSIPKLNMSILGDHVLLDARLAFLAGKVLKIDENIIIQALESYT